MQWCLIIMLYAYDNSIIGTTFDGRTIYDFAKMVRELMDNENWTEEEAVEWIEFNTIRALPYGGEKRPMIVFYGGGVTK